MILIILTISFLLAWKLPVRRVGLLCDPTGGVLTAALIVGAGAYQANSQIKQGQAQKRYYDAMAQTAINQGLAIEAANKKKSEISQDIGSQQVKAAAVKGAEAGGYQRAAISANNMGTGGSAQDIAIDTMRKTNQDELNLKYNSDTKSWEFETEGAYAKWQGNEQGNQYNFAGKSALIAAKRQATATMIATAASVASFGALGGFAGLGAKAGVNTTLAGVGGASGGMTTGGVSGGTFLSGVGTRTGALMSI